MVELLNSLLSFAARAVTLGAAMFFVSSFRRDQLNARV